MKWIFIMLLLVSCASNQNQPVNNDDDYQYNRPEAYGWRF